MTSQDGEGMEEVEGDVMTQDLEAWLSKHNLQSLYQGLKEQGFDTVEIIFEAREPDLWGVLDDIQPTVKPAIKIKFINIIKKAVGSRLYKDEHNTLPVNIIYNAAEMGMIEKLLECIKGYETIVKENPNNFELLKTASNNCREKINNHFNAVSTLLEERKQTLLKSIDVFENETIDKLKEQSITVEQSLKELNETKTECNNELSNLKDITKLIERKEKINKTINQILPAKSDYLKKIVPIHITFEISSSSISKINKLIENFGNVIRPDIPRPPQKVIFIPNIDSAEVILRKEIISEFMDISEYELKLWDYLPNEKNENENTKTGKEYLIDVKNYIIENIDEINEYKKKFSAKSINYEEQKEEEKNDKDEDESDSEEKNETKQEVEKEEKQDTKYIYIKYKLQKLKADTIYYSQIRCKNYYGWSPSTNYLKFKTWMEIFGTGTQTLIVNNTKILSDGLNEYDTIIIESGGKLTVTSYESSRSGGTLLLNVRTLLHIKSGGRIDLTGHGYSGGKSVSNTSDGFAYQGESYTGNSMQTTSPNYGGGGGGIASSSYGGTGGGGGGYGTRGNNAEDNKYSGQVHPGGQGGLTYGDERIAILYRGSGGGSGHPYSSSGTSGYRGGNGGGALRIYAFKIINDGEILCNGENAPSTNNGTYASGGGGGSGGSILIKSITIINNGTINCIGGKGASKGNNSSCSGINSDGGDGGNGRIRLDVTHLKNDGIISPQIGYRGELQDLDCGELDDGRKVNTYNNYQNGNNFNFIANSKMLQRNLKKKKKKYDDHREKKDIFF